MFERYTEKARRVIFFARYEASQYGNAYIESEHLLLGLVREDLALMKRLVAPSTSLAEIRTEIEKEIKRGTPISTSVEVPLTEECKKILVKAGEEAERLRDRHVGTEHLLLAILDIEKSLAARILLAKGVRAAALREELARTLSAVRMKSRPRANVLATVDGFLAGLKWYSWEKLQPFFAKYAQFVDAAGKVWKGRDEIEKQFETLFAPYAKKNVSFLLESANIGADEYLVAANVLWENVSVSGEAARGTHRMTIVLVPQEEGWAIFLIQVTPVVVR
jgi:uncharacterized protein (TIGR02246 family)